MYKSTTPHFYQFSTLPIIIVENELQNYKNMVVKGQVMVTSIVAMVQVKCNHRNKHKASAK